MSFVIMISFVGCGEKTIPDNGKTDQGAGVESNDIDYNNVTSTPTVTENSDKNDLKNTESPKEDGAFEKLNVGDVIKFGSYEQDNDTTNGNEEIEWVILDKADGKVFVISSKQMQGMILRIRFFFLAYLKQRSILNRMKYGCVM